MLNKLSNHLLIFIVFLGSSITLSCEEEISEIGTNLGLNSNTIISVDTIEATMTQNVIGRKLLSSYVIKPMVGEINDADFGKINASLVNPLYRSSLFRAFDNSVNIFNVSLLMSFDSIVTGNPKDLIRLSIYHVKNGPGKNGLALGEAYYSNSNYEDFYESEKTLIGEIALDPFNELRLDTTFQDTTMNIPLALSFGEYFMELEREFERIYDSLDTRGDSSVLIDTVDAFFIERSGAILIEANRISNGDEGNFVQLDLSNSSIQIDYSHLDTIMGQDSTYTAEVERRYNLILARNAVSTSNAVFTTVPNINTYTYDYTGSALEEQLAVNGNHEKLYLHNFAGSMGKITFPGFTGLPEGASVLHKVELFVGSTDYTPSAFNYFVNRIGLTKDMNVISAYDSLVTNTAENAYLDTANAEFRTTLSFISQLFEEDEITSEFDIFIYPSFDYFLLGNGRFRNNYFAEDLNRIHKTIVRGNDNEQKVKLIITSSN